MTTTVATDPVCKITVPEGDAAATTEHRGRTYSFGHRRPALGAAAGCPKGAVF